MASTNKTTNYNLSQFIGTDKPAWLADYNQDMSKIDTGIHTAQTTATGADGKADSNATKIGDLTTLTTDTKTSLVGAVNEVDAHADTAQNTANSAATAANTANTNIAKFNLADKQTLTPTSNKGSIQNAYTQVQYAGDTTGSVYKLYGRIYIIGLENLGGTLNITIGTTPLRPTTSYTVNTGVLLARSYLDGKSDTVPRNFTVNTDGTITLTDTIASNLTEMSVILPPCLYFNSDFGD